MTYGWVALLRFEHMILQPLKPFPASGYDYDSNLYLLMKLRGAESPGQFPKQVKHNDN